jgi:hypothetical protein
VERSEAGPSQPRPRAGADDELLPRLISHWRLPDARFCRVARGTAVEQVTLVPSVLLLKLDAKGQIGAGPARAAREHGLHSKLPVPVVSPSLLRDSSSACLSATDSCTRPPASPRAVWVWVRGLNNVVFSGATLSRAYLSQSFILNFIIQTI